MGSAIGIEQKSSDAVVQTYQDYGCANFAIYSGRRLCVKYDEGNIDQGLSMLVNYLNIIQNSGTTAVYVLYVYGNDVKKITTGTDYEGSTTFQLTSFQGANNGNTFIVPANQGGGVQKPSIADPAIKEELAELRRERETLKEKLHQQELDRMREDFAVQISGLKEQKTGFDKFMEILDKNGDKIQKFLEYGIDKLTGTSKNYIVDRPGASMSGTTASQTTESETDMQTDLTNEGALINPFLSDEEKKLKKKEQGPIIISKLTALSQEDLESVQMECLEIIEKRITPITVTRMLLAVACLDNDDLNKLLNNLD